MTTAPLEISEKLYTVEEWLDLEKRSEVRHEYYYGKLIAMAGGAKRANIIVHNLVKLMDDHLFEHGYETFSDDVKAQVVPGGIYRYPDVVVAPLVDDDDEYIVKLPVMMCEVASQQSANRDRVKKRKEYQQIPTLWYYLILSQDEMWVEMHSKLEGGNWVTNYFTEPNDAIHLERLSLKLTLSDIYKRTNIHP